jgi:hypothetical protein
MKKTLPETAGFYILRWCERDQAVLMNVDLLEFEIDRIVMDSDVGTGRFSARSLRKRERVAPVMRASSDS